MIVPFLDDAWLGPNKNRLEMSGCSLEPYGLRSIQKPSGAVTFARVTLVQLPLLC